MRGGAGKTQQSWDTRRWESFPVLCTKGRKVAPTNPEAETFPAEWLDSDELFRYVSPSPTAFYQWLSSSPASLDIKQKCSAQKAVCDRHAAAVINVLIQAGASPPSQLITVQYFGSHYILYHFNIPCSYHWAHVPLKCDVTSSEFCSFLVVFLLY